MPSGTVPDWTSPAPGPVPPGVLPTPPTLPLPTAPGWSDWIDGIANSAYSIRYPTSLYTPAYHVSIDKVEYGPTITVPLNGGTPSAWAPDGATRASTGLVGIDFTRYKRTYPQIKLQNFQSISVTITVWWGNYWTGHFLPFTNYYGHTTTGVFWQAVGNFTTVGPKAAYRWQQTSRGSQFKVVAPGTAQFDVGLAEFIPNPPPADPPGGRPDDFGPDHENPYPALPEPKGLPDTLKSSSVSGLQEDLALRLTSPSSVWPSEISVGSGDNSPEEFPPELAWGWRVTRVDLSRGQWFTREQVIAAIADHKGKQKTQKDG